MLAEIAGKTVGKKLEQQEGAPKGLYLRVGEAKGGGALGGHLQWAIELLKGFFREDAVMTNALYLQQSSIGVKADAP